AQQNPVTVLFTLFPYDGNQVAPGLVPIPRDVTKIAYGLTGAEVCAKRTEAEIITDFNTSQTPVLFVGIVQQQFQECGYIWFNKPTFVPVTPPLFSGIPVGCTQLNQPPAGAPPPPQCFRVGSPKDAGCCGTPPTPVPGVGNPINPGTGN